MSLKLVPTTQFKRDFKRLQKRGCDVTELQAVLERLCAQEPLAEKHHDHALAGNYIGFRECHIRPDWLLIYAIDGGRLILTASRTGTHADLFSK
jgi:mRNA interferase YafQ